MEGTMTNTMSTHQVTMEKKSEPLVEDVTNGDIISYNGIDPALAAKMHIVNDAINQIGFTGYHLKLFFLNGFGYAVDSLLAILMSITAGQVTLEFQPSYIRGGQLALYIGLLFGALFWGISADIVGRKWAFNLSLLIASIFAIISGAAPNYIAWCSFVALCGFGAGGNLVLDTTVFLEYLPAKSQWLLTFMAIWWGIGQTVSGLLAWAFIPNFSCKSAPCARSDNMGWRYLWYTAGALVLVMSIARVTIIRFHETPKYLLCKGLDAEVVKLLQDLAHKHGRTCDITVEQLTRHGKITSTHSEKLFSLAEITIHFRGLFSTRKLAVSTTLLWASWSLIGLAYPLFYVFLPEYLSSRGAQFGQTSVYVTWRDYVLAQFSSIFGPLLAGLLCMIPRLGRKYTMVIGALLSMAFLFAYTAVRNNAENVGFNCVVSFAINVYYGTLYAYGPEVLPSAHRGTGNSISLALGRFFSIVAVIVATFADTSTPVPVYVCAAAFSLMAIVSALFPFEPQRSQSS